MLPHKPGLRGLCRLRRRPWVVRRFVIERLGQERKVQEELAAHTGAFMLAVAQNGFRRMFPSQPVPRTLEELMQEPRPFQFSAYLERYGGYQQQRDLGVMMFMLSQVADLMLAGNYLGAMDRLALVLVSISWATVALAYLKEADSSLARRNKANAGAPPPKAGDEGGEPPKRPRRPCFPKAPKQDK